MALANNERDFTKLRIKKDTLPQLQRIKAAMEIKDGRRRFIHEIISEWAENEVKKIDENE